jgi:hypothetical protein
MKLLFIPQLLINQSLCFCGWEKKQMQTQNYKQAHVSNNFYSCLDVENIVLRNGYGVDAMPRHPAPSYQTTTSCHIFLDICIVEAIKYIYIHIYIYIYTYIYIYKSILNRGYRYWGYLCPKKIMSPSPYFFYKILP